MLILWYDVIDPIHTSSSKSELYRVRKKGAMLLLPLTMPNANRFLANVKLFAVARPSVCLSSVVCNARVPYSGRSNCRQYFYGIWYLDHPMTSTENFTEIVPGKPLRRGS